MNDVLELVYESMKDSTERIREKLDHKNDLEERKASGRYSDQVIKDELEPEIYKLRREIENDSDQAIKDALQVVEDYQEKLRKMDDLDPSMINDDIKLFQSGIKLTPRDIQAVIDRNTENETMTQIALRYAEDNDIKLGVTYVGHTEAIAAAESVKGAVSYLRGYIASDNALEMYRRLLGMEG